MTQEDKNLLLKDLSARLPYGVKVRYKSVEGEGDIKLGYGNIGYVPELGRGWWIECKPYLRPMSSMTEDECITLSKLIPYETDAWKYIRTPIPLYIANIEQFDFFHSHHLDWRGLIHKGLAIEVTEENNPYKE